MQKCHTQPFTFAMTATLLIEKRQLFIIKPNTDAMAAKDIIKSITSAHMNSFSYNLLNKSIFRMSRLTYITETNNVNLHGVDFVFNFFNRRAKKQGRTRRSSVALRRVSPCLKDKR